jgi:hypothetical protein
VSSPEVVLVDARNVLRSRWPNIPEQELVERCGAWARREATSAFVVFDGRAPGVGVGERELAPELAVVGTGGESADDWLVRRAAELAAAGRVFWLVTSDRELRERTRTMPEHVIGGGSFAGLLLAD